MTETSAAPAVAQSSAHSVSLPEPRASRRQDRGLTAVVHPTVLQRDIWLRALSTLNRFRVIRAIDIAVACFPERPFKAALTAAQRAMRGLAKAKFVRRYRTNRFQHIYGLTTRGARWLQEHDVTAAASVRRVSEKTNPEHQLWMNFIVLACEARGLLALTESEVWDELNPDTEKGQPLKQGLTKVDIKPDSRKASSEERTIDLDVEPPKPKWLRPDAIAIQGDDVTWFEIDISTRGSYRATALTALATKIGCKLENGKSLRRVVVMTRDEIVYRRHVQLMRKKMKSANEADIFLTRGCHFNELAEGVFEVIAPIWDEKASKSVLLIVGHVIFQLLPTWLPKVRLDASNRQPLSGWFEENYLPYRRPKSARPWPTPSSPLLRRHSMPSK
ncbi:replication-relaxation family protein [Cupriavidus sp. TMH.W2]|uniref:replication-relaxation family protein n=1 Tax=Cupriavidus sp. TMH.W2 TaxID=3434465 RepID=UPI003D789168